MTDYEKFLQMMEEYENSGGDFASFKSHIGALAAGNATPFLGLNRWKSSDKPVMEDFNRDNELIDAAVQELWSKKADKEPVSWVNVSLEGEMRGALRYRKAYGVVYIEGWVSGAQIGDVIMALPEGFRPSRNISKICPTAGNYDIARLVVSDTGEVRATRSSNEKYLNDGLGMDISFSAAGEL